MTFSSMAKVALTSRPARGTKKQGSLSQSVHFPRNRETQIEPDEDASYAHETVAEIFAESAVVDVDRPIDLPSFSPEELRLGKLLGSGNFGVVFEVKRFDLKVKNHELHDTVLQEGRKFMAQHCLRRKNLFRRSCRYAIKQLIHRDDNDSRNEYVQQGLIDMGIETHLLSIMEHPNIIKLRGFMDGGLYCKNYFIVLDRLYDIMDRKLKAWQTKLARAQKRKRQDKLETLLEERLAAAFGLSCGLAYLHGNHIIYRDLKPENIGFDIRGDVKIFDFGLATEVLPQNMDDDGTYLLSANTGTPRYISPEAALGQPYNCKTDVYSFSLLLWELMVLQKPYAGYDLNLLKEQVYLGGTRPSIDNINCPGPVVSLIESGWLTNFKRRPDMATITNRLKVVLKELRSGDDSGLEDIRRRSTHIFDSRNRAHIRALLHDNLSDSPQGKEQAPRSNSKHKVQWELPGILQERISEDDSDVECILTPIS